MITRRNVLKGLGVWGAGSYLLQKVEHGYGHVENDWKNYPSAKEDPDVFRYLSYTQSVLTLDPCPSPPPTFVGGIKKSFVAAYHRGETSQVFIPGFHIAVEISSKKAKVMSRRVGEAWGEGLKCDFGKAASLLSSLAGQEREETLAALDQACPLSMVFQVPEGELGGALEERALEIEGRYGECQILAAGKRTYVLPPKQVLGVMPLYKPPRTSPDGKYLFEEVGICIFSQDFYRLETI